MRFTRDHLVWKALVAVDEAVEASRAGPVQRSWALRFALAYLWSVRIDDTDAHAALWRILADPVDACHQSQSDYQRGTLARREMHRIARSLGLEPAGDLFARLAEARGPVAVRHARRASDAVHDAHAQRIADEDHRRGR